MTSTSTADGWFLATSTFTHRYADDAGDVESGPTRLGCHPQPAFVSLSPGTAAFALLGLGVLALRGRRLNPPAQRATLVTL